MKRTVFYLDDDPSQLQLFREIFEGRDYDIQTAVTLHEARSMLAECDPEIIISDQKMPDISGADFLREAAQTCPHSFRIMLTGTATVGEMMSELSTGIIHLFISKPWTEAEMQAALERAATSLDRSAASRSEPGKPL
jgi:DNA-binding NtrC family response regulator